MYYLNKQILKVQTSIMYVPLKFDIKKGSLYLKYQEHCLWIRTVSILQQSICNTKTSESTIARYRFFMQPRFRRTLDTNTTLQLLRTLEECRRVKTIHKLHILNSRTIPFEYNFTKFLTNLRQLIYLEEGKCILKQICLK